MPTHPAQPAGALYKTDDAALARHLGISQTAVALTRQSDFIDLHLDTFIPARLFGYDVHKHHAQVLGKGHFFGHLDTPRAHAAGLTGALWSITTNPARSRQGRWQTFVKNLHTLRYEMNKTGISAVVKNIREYQQARKNQEHACFIAIQGGNALSAAPNLCDDIPDQLVIAVTLVHLTSSEIGQTSTPIVNFFGPRGLTDLGRDVVRSLNKQRIFVDLAHISPRGFWDAVAVHDKSQPLINSHTGVSGVTPHWRNLDDKQMKAIADTGGVVAMIFHNGFIRQPQKPMNVDRVVDHIVHALHVIGEDFIAIGTDYDGAIIPPRDLRDGLALPRLVEAMLQRNLGETCIQKILGGNYLRALQHLRP